jgi:hypothetical protein
VVMRDGRVLSDERRGQRRAEPSPPPPGEDQEVPA